MGLIAEVVGVARRALVRWWKRLLRRRSEPRRPRRGRPRVVSEVARDAIRGKYVAKHGQWGPAVLACWARREGLGSFSPTTVSRLVSDLRPTPEQIPLESPLARDTLRPPAKYAGREISMRNAALRTVLAAAVILGLLGCNDTSLTALLSDGAHSASDYTLEVVASTDTVEAGGSVSFTVTLRDRDGVDVTAAYDIGRTISPALGVLADGDDTYRFTFTDTYTYFASVDLLGSRLVATAAVDVTPGAAASLTIQADPPLIVAGDTVKITPDVRDAYGNPTEGNVGYSVTPVAQVDGDEVTATVAGLYEVTGVLSGADATATDTFSVVPADPATLSISLSSYDVEVGQGVVVDIQLRDAYGNDSDVPVDLSTDPGSGTRAWGSFVRFDQEGRFTVHADVPAFGLHDDDGPVLVDSSGPQIRVTTPDRGEEIREIDQPVVTVSGSVSEVVSPAGMTVTINGAPATLTNNGLFSFQMTPEKGLNEIDVVATDGDGNVSDHYQTYLWGDFLPMGDPNEDGIVARLNEGAIDTIEDMVDDLLDITSVGAGLANTTLWQSGNWCPLSWFGGAISLCGNLVAQLASVTLGSLTVDLDPQWGYLDTYVAIAPLEFDVSLTATFTGCFIACASVSITAGVVAHTDATEVWTDVYPSVNNNNEIEVALANTQTGLQGFTLNFYGLGLISSFMNLISGWLTPVLTPLLEAALGPIVQSQLPPIIEQALAGVALAQDIPLLGATIELEALPQDITVDPDGMTITLETVTTTQLGANAPATFGAFNRDDYTLPSYGATPDFGMSMADNFVNQLLHAVWQAGVMDMSMGGAELGFDLSSVSDILPLTTIEFETMPLLPPVIGPSSTGNDLLEFAIGDMMVNIWGDPGGQYGLMMQLAVTVLSDADLSIVDEQIEFGIGTPVVIMDFVTSDWPDLDGEVAENLMDAVVNLIVPTLTDTLDDLGGIEIPAIAGLQMGNPSIIREPSPTYYITASGDLTVAAP